MDYVRLVKGYMEDETLRHALNELTEQTFGFHFESWVTNGYFEGDYIPYSFEKDGKIVSNVSVNRMHFVQNGEKRFYIQLGTVMTAADCRKQGLARKLMECVINEYEGACDGIYLFGNLNARGFYRKLGFEERLQYRYTLKEEVRHDLQSRNSVTVRRGGFARLDPQDAKSKKTYGEAVRNSVIYGAFDQENKYGLQMFYTSNLENVFYSENLDCFAVMEQEGDLLELQSVISPKDITLENIIREIDLGYQVLRLGFTPQKDEAELFDAAVFDGGDDYRLFCRGRRLESIERDKLYFPTFSHA